jgi:glucosamine--fructose-6-phosphate aminotransferase (isomerizing)
LPAHYGYGKVVTEGNQKNEFVRNRKPTTMSISPPIRSLHTLSEILSQPEIWQTGLAGFVADPACKAFVGKAGSHRERVFVGCGTSYYVAEAAAANWTKLTGKSARAVPASEVLLFPDLLRLEAGETQAVIISRSGKTSEAIRAAEAFARRRIATFGITCVAGSELTKVCESTAVIAAADEQSLVMTRSFSTMLLGLTLLAAEVGGKRDYASAINTLAEQVLVKIESCSERVENFAAERSFDDYIYLGQGPFFSIAREGCLKITEMSCSYAQAYHTLEFRHGPKAVVGAKTCLTFFLSESGMVAESEVLAEMKALGGIIIGICNRAPETVRRSCDLLIELQADVPEPLSVAGSIVPAQLLGLHTAIKKGLNPDEPKNLSRVVILD